MKQTPLIAVGIALAAVLAFVFYVSSNGDSVHIVRDDANELLPSVPEFRLPLPPMAGIPSTITSLSVQLFNPLSVECALDPGTGGFDCSDVQVEIENFVIVDNLVVSTGSQMPRSDQCTDFGEVHGSPGINGPSMTLVAWTTIRSNPLDKFIGALVVVVLPLELAIP